MKNRSPFFAGARLLMNILVNFMLALFVSVPISAFAGTDPMLLAGGITVAGVAYQTGRLLFAGLLPVQGAFFMAIQKEIWEKDIVENLFKDNQFLNYAFNADMYVLQGKVVHIPQAGAVPTVVKNRSSLPATVTQRTDTDITYSIDELTTDPILIPNADTIELSYDKRQSVMAETYAAIREVAAENILRTWAPSAAGSIIRTTGADVAAHLDGSTGYRKKMITADLKRAQLLMNRQNIPTTERYAMFSADMIDQLTDSLTDTQYRDFSKAYDEKAGVVGKLYGFNIMSRSSTVSYLEGSPPTLVALGAAGAATHCDAAICWHKNSVERALGEVKFFENTQDPQYYGDIYSALVRIGGRKRRTDSKGVVAIVQAIGTGGSV